jgi:presequence protease
MNFKNALVSFIIFALLIMSTAIYAEIAKGETMHGFKLLEKRFVNEVNADCYYFEHIKSGARLLKIAAPDANKTFSISFKTTPESDSGTPHIMEHSVLNGSKNFPVKSPFDVLAKGSLNTFLNAMTGSDITIYPVASMNDKDFFNLMHVYLDAVLYPRIYDDPRILQQEGWHHELTSKDEDVVYKGVVYNEMKGAFSSPTRELDYQVYKHLYPDSPYGFSSGGYPPAIPELTHEAFLNFHKKYYHPSNSYIYLYGDADMEKELEFINDKYLSNFDKSDAVVKIDLQKPFTEIKKIVEKYPLSEDSDTEDQSYLTLNFVAGSGEDRALVMALDVLEDVLINQESAPIRLALQEAGIGREVSGGVDDIKQNLFQIMVQNANPEDADEFHRIIVETLKEVVKNGLDKEAVEGSMNRMEFRLREGDDAQKGLTYNFQAIAGWFYADDPFLSLEYEKPLKKVKSALTSDYLESLVEKYMLNNNHALLLTLQPEPGMEQKIKDAAAVECADYKAAMSDKELEDLINSTNELVEYQKSEDTPEALATIPMLAKEDINPKAEWWQAKEKKVADTKLLHYSTFSNNVVYVNYYFDLRVLPTELIPYASLLTDVLAKLNTKNYAFGDLDKALNIHTGGFSTYLNSYLENRDDANLLPKLVVSSKTMNTKLEKLFELNDEIINSSIFDDKDRLKSVLTRRQSRMDASIKRNGFAFARMRLASYFTSNGLFDEITGGAEYYWFLTDLVENFDDNSENIIQNFQKAASLIFSQDNLIVAVTCDDADMPTFSKGVASFIATLPDQQATLKKWNLKREKKNEGLLTASKVQYVLQGWDFKQLGYKWDGSMRVLNQVLSRDYLQNTIRVLGGAYGGFSSFSPSGRAYFASYRDPNLKETLDNYAATPKWLHEFEADETEMTRLIIGAIAQMDKPLTPSEKGSIAFRRYFQKTTGEMAQNDRDAVINTTPEEIRSMEKMISDILGQKAWCVYGNEDKIESEKTLFNNVIELTR